MKSLVIFDSVYGNTEAVARAVARGLAGGAEAVKADAARGLDLHAFDLVVLGSPTLGGRPSQAMQGFLGSLRADALKGVKVAAFDTRMSVVIARLFGHAADRMAAALVAKGGTLACPAHGFVVKGRQGPLADGEEEKAAAWARQLA